MNEAKGKWLKYQNGRLTLHTMFQHYGNKICIHAPERYDRMPLLISKLQRNLLEMRQSTISNLCYPE